LVVPPHRGVLIKWCRSTWCGSNWCGNNWLGRHQAHIVTPKRAVDEGLLSVAGRLQHVIANKSECLSKIEARFRKVIYQCLCEGAVLVAIGCSRPRLRGESYHRIRT